MSILDELKFLRLKYGYSQFDHAVKQLSRERLQIDNREKRKQPSPAKKQKMFDRQGGFCPWCNDRLDVPARLNHADHIDPNNPNFNDVRNYQLLHEKCNLEKSSMTIEEQSKRKGRTFREILGRSEKAGCDTE